MFLRKETETTKIERASGSESPVGCFQPQRTPHGAATEGLPLFPTQEGGAGRGEEIADPNQKVGETL